MKSVETCMLGAPEVPYFSRHKSNAAVRNDLGAGHVGVVIGHHERHQLGHFDGFSEAAHAGCLLELLGVPCFVHPESQNIQGDPPNLRSGLG